MGSGTFLYLTPFFRSRFTLSTTYAPGYPLVPGDAQIESLRLPPHSVEAEQAVLGGLLLSNSSWDRIGDVVTESDFYRADHRILWRVITRLVEDLSLIHIS